MNEYNGIIKIRKRLLAIFLLVIFLFCILFCRLIYLQIFQYSELSIIATNQWYRDLPLDAERGLIYDTCGDVLADNKLVYTIYIRPNAITDNAEVAEVLATQLGLDYDAVYESTNKSTSEVTIAKQVSEDIGKTIASYNFEGVHVSQSSMRNYPESSMLSKVIGFANIDNEGQNGLEGYYDKYLTGTDGIAYSFADIAGRETDSMVTGYIPAIDGCDLTLSIDSSIQAFAENAVMGAQHEWDSLSASAIVMDVDTGGIVAMASYPSYDLNNVPRDDIDILNYLSKNTMITDVYEPGSTFKAFTTALALENNCVDLDKEYYCNGSAIVDGQRIKCWKTQGHGSQTLAEGVCNSCNIVFMELAQNMGVDLFYEGLEDFGFGSQTGVDFFGESAGIMMNSDSVKTVDLARIGFGQAIAVTPLQLITGISALVNGGTLNQPAFLDKVTYGEDTLIYEKGSTKKRTVISNDTSAYMRELLGNVVETGGGKNASVDGYSIGGKTGTAQKYEDGVIAQGKYVSSFVGFAPVDDPKYAVLFLVDEPSGYVYYGSLTAAPYAGQIFKSIFEYEGTQPDKIIEEKTYVSIPSVEGMSYDEASSLLEDMGFMVEVVGEGDSVISITPSPMTTVEENSIVLLRMDDY